MPSRALFLTTLTLALSFACTQSEADACGKGEVYRDGDCHPAPAASAGTAPLETAGGASDGGAPGDAGEPVDPNFGLACSADVECTAPTDYCVPASPFDTAYCSTRDCTVGDASACPSGYTCTDLSRFVAGLPTACTRPTD